MTRLSEDQRKERAREKARKWRRDHPGYYAQYNKEYRESHRDEISENQREYLLSYVYKWQIDEEAAQNRRAYNRRYHAEHREGISARHAAANRTPEGRVKRITYARRRQSLLENTPPDVVREADGLVSVWRTVGAICYLCGRLLPPSAVATEHRVPLSKGGTHSLGNIAPSCKQCNSSKHNRICPAGWGG